jgi:hypothetical protein
VVPDLVLKIVGVMHLAHRALEEFNHSILDLILFVEQRVFPESHQVLVSWLCGIESKLVWPVNRSLDPIEVHWLPSPLGHSSFYLDQVRLSVRWSRIPWAWLLNNWSLKLLNSRILNMSCILDSVYFWPSDHVVRYCSHLAWSCEVLHKLSNNLIAIHKIWQIYYFIIWNVISTYCSPLVDGLNTCVTAAGKK